MGCSADDSRVDLPSVSSPLGEREREAARRSRSSRRRFSFLPVRIFSFLFPILNCGSSSCGKHTVIALSNAVLNSSALSKIRDLGPILIWVCASSEFCGR